MEVQILSRKLVKPSTPTPPHLRNYRISLLDEVSPRINVPSILYYPPNASNGSIYDHLEKSLAQTLTQFYPLAGRYIKSSHLVDCSDQGVEYVEARVDGQLHKILGQGMKSQLLNHFIPCEIGAADEITDPLLAIQVNKFECGGLAIAVCFSHRIADASTLSTLINSWANTTRGENSGAICPSFDMASFLPGRNFPSIEFGIPREGTNGLQFVTRMFSFSKKAISILKTKAKPTHSSKRHPSKVQVVSALILGALLSIDREKHGHLKATLVVQTVNLRDKTIPPLPKHSCGNLWGVATTQCKEKENKMEFQGLVETLGDAIMATVTECNKIQSTVEDGYMTVVHRLMEWNESIGNNEINVYLFTSWCRFPLYEADFGWGKPIWASLANFPLKNFAFLMDNQRGDGIEAWVSLDEKDMLIFEQDLDIRAFTT